MPERIQRQRTKGWRLPEGAIYVGRPGPYGSPFPVSSGRGRPTGTRSEGWLEPLRPPCHADVLLELANA